MNKCRKVALWTFAIVLSVMLMSFTCMASENTGNPIELYIGDVQVSGAILENNTAYAPYRALVSAIDQNAEYTWNNDLRASVASTMGMEIFAFSGEHYIEANGRVLYNQNATNLNIDEVLYVPVRSIAKAYGLGVEWNAAKMTVTVSGTASVIQSGDDYYDADILYWLSRIISAESKGEPLVGQIAVGNVIINRTEAGSFPDTVYGVIFDNKFGTQFTPAATGSVYNSPTDSATRAAKIAIEGTEVVEDALFFCANRVNNGSWMQNNREYIETIGNHVFYA